MTYQELTDICAGQESGGYFVLPERVFEEIDAGMAGALARKYHNQRMIRLPEKEITFFEWLRRADEPVWNDLWGSESEEERYIVAISFLPLLVYSVCRGFPICDLLEADNYFFTPAHMVDAESKTLIESARTLFTERLPMTPAQLLALEISIDPTDIWHFAYKHKIALGEAKKAVQELVDDHALVHFKSAEHLASFIDF